MHDAESVGAPRAAESVPGFPGRSARVVVVDDEAEIAELVVQLLRDEGFSAAAFTDPVAMLRACDECAGRGGRGGGAFDLAIIDVMMPQMTGFELCEKLRARSDAPILFLSARDEEIDKVAGFSLGADDYVTKPFKPRELVARVRAHLRRAQRGGATSPRMLQAGGLEVDADAHAATLWGVPLTLTPKEFGMLALLVERGGKPVPAAELFENVWHERFDDAAANTVMVHIRHLRSKLAEVDSSQQFIQTVWGVGYRVQAERGTRATAEADGAASADRAVEADETGGGAHA